MPTNEQTPTRVLETDSQEEPFGLREYLAVIWVRRWVISLVTILAAGSAFFYTSRQTPVYQTSARVQVESSSQELRGEPTPVNMETERELATSGSVAEFVADRLQADVPPESLLTGLTVEVIPETEILIFTYDSSDPGHAQEMANAFAGGYLDYRRHRQIEDLLSTDQAIQEQINQTETDLRRVTRELARGVGETARVTLEAERNALSARLSVLQQQLLAGGSDLHVGQLLQEAAFPTVSLGRDYVRNLSLALMVGIGLGAGLAFVIERLDDRLKGRHDLETFSTVPVLAVVPRAPGWKKRVSVFLATLAEPSSPVAEAYRTLRTGILFAASQRPMRTILVTSPDTGAGKTTTTANLGVALARAGKRVVLVAADLRRPRLQAFFDLGNGNGLTNVLAGELEAVKALKPAKGIPNLRVLASGPIPGNPAELLSSPVMTRVLFELSQDADFVLIDAAPILAVSDALSMSRIVDAVLLVADAQRTSRSSIQQARKQLTQINAQVVGSVLNNYNPRTVTSSHYMHDEYPRFEANHQRRG